MIGLGSDERSAVLRRLREQLSAPLARPDGEFLVFNDGTPNGFRYPFKKIDQRYPLSDLFALPWFTEAHGLMAMPHVRAWLDEQVNKRARPRAQGPGVHFDQ